MASAPNREVYMPIREQKPHRGQEGMAVDGWLRPDNCRLALALMTSAPRLATRLRGFGTTIFAEMTALALRTEAINLGQGFPDTDGPPAVTEAAQRAIVEGRNQYPPLNGVPELRSAIARHQSRFRGIEVDPDQQVVVTAGATEALAAALLGLCEPGDEVVVFDPTYDSYMAGIALAGAVARPVVLRPPSEPGGRFYFDRNELVAAFSERTRLILFNSPHNPTGKVFDDDELALIAELCLQHDVVGVTDEVYEHMVFEGRHRPLSTFDGMADRTLAISSAGKTFSVTGWKVGWATGPADLVAAVRTAKQYLTFVNAGPFQYAVAEGLDLDDAYYSDLAEGLRTKRDLLADHLDRAGFGLLPVDGTYFLTADVSPFLNADTGFGRGIEFCLGLPELAGVVAVPSEVFYADPDNGANLVRFCFTKRDEVLVEAGRRLIDALG